MDHNLLKNIIAMQAGFANSAQQLSDAHEAFEQQVAHVTEKDKAILQTAKNTEKHNMLLSQQVDTLIENKKLLERQNEELYNQNKLLQEAYDSVKTESEYNKRQAQKSKIFGWISFVVSTFIAIGSLVVAIIAICK